MKKITFLFLILLLIFGLAIGQNEKRRPRLEDEARFEPAIQCETKTILCHCECTSDGYWCAECSAIVCDFGNGNPVLLGRESFRPLPEDCRLSPSAFPH